MSEQKNPKFLLRVNCMTYNHAPYIVDAMNGFTMQQTTFPFVCVIVDDASTDGEQKIIQDYLIKNFVLSGNEDYHRDETEDYVRIFTRHKTNCNCFFVVFYLKYNHYSIKKNKGPYYREWTNTKYIALCEGDDYWTVSDKLQRQVDFLESHPDYSMCFHGADIIVESGSFSEDRLHQFDNLETREYSGEEIVNKWIIPTASIVYHSFIKPPVDRRFVVGDLVLRNQCTIEGKVFCFSDVMSIYRLNSGSVTSNPISFNRAFLHEEALIEHFPKYESIYKNKLRRMIISALHSRQCLDVIFFLLINPRFIGVLFYNKTRNSNTTRFF